MGPRGARNPNSEPKQETGDSARLAAVARETASLNRALEALRREIAERQRAEEELRRLKLTFEHMWNGVLITDGAGNITEWNPGAERMFGVTRDVMLDRLLSALPGAPLRPRLEQQVLAGVQHASFWTGELSFTRPDGSECIASMNVVPVWDQEGVLSSTVCVCRDITERKRVETEMRRAREAAELADRAKSEFLANVSHEIRTPLNGIIGLTELTLDTELQPEQREHLELVKSAADNLLQIINDLLDFSTIEVGKLALLSVPYRLQELLRDTIRPLSIRAHERAVAMTCHIRPDVPDSLVGDPGRLRQVLTNLIGNSVKFTDHGEINVRVGLQKRAEEELTLLFSVRDTGIGIPKDKQSLIFEAFSQADSSSTRNYGGTGLGLAIASRLVELMGGRIWVESQPGQGSTFYFTVMVHTTAGAAPQARRRPRIGAPEPENDLAKSPPSQPDAVVTAPPAAPRARQAWKVLLAEDNPVNQKVAVRMLEVGGCTVKVAGNGREALEALAADSYDILLLDLQMPEKNGLEVAAEIREQEQRIGGHLPIIALTAHAMKGDKEKCLQVGMDAYFSKPFKREEVLAAIDQLAGRFPQSPKSPAPTAPEAGAKVKVLDYDSILAQYEEDPDLLLEVIDVFREDSIKQRKRLHEALQAGDAAAFGKVAHTIKGAVSNLFAPSAQEAALRLEMIGKSGDLRDARAALQDLEAKLDRLDPELVALVQEIPLWGT